MPESLVAPLLDMCAEARTQHKKGDCSKPARWSATAEPEKRCLTMECSAAGEKMSLLGAQKGRERVALEANVVDDVSRLCAKRRSGQPKRNMGMPSLLLLHVTPGP